jgi:glycosyltransferase involved in cell wall biosynthesis
MRFLFLSGTIADRSAIGRDVVGMYDLLAPRAECFLHGDSVDAGGRRTVSRAETKALLADPETTAIYHHSVYWESGEDLFAGARARLVFKYHNITPPDQFAGFEAYWNGCLQGREQTYRLVHRYRNALWLSDSLFNLEELGISLLPRRAVVPPFLSPETRPNSELLEQLIEEPAIHLLTVGRIVPNKGHHFLVRVVEAMKRLFGRPVTASIVGALDPICQGYYDSVIEEARRPGVEAHIRFAGLLSEEELLSYYLGADVYVCSSSHEGFCVPLVEAQRARLPVVARNSGAVRETLGPGQILLGDDPEEHARAIERLCGDESFRNQVVERGAANYQARFTRERIAEAFLRALDIAPAAPIP